MFIRPPEEGDGTFMRRQRGEMRTVPPFQRLRQANRLSRPWILRIRIHRLQHTLRCDCLESMEGQDTVMKPRTKLGRFMEHLRKEAV